MRYRHESRWPSTLCTALRPSRPTASDTDSGEGSRHHAYSALHCQIAFAYGSLHFGARRSGERSRHHAYPALHCGPGAVPISYHTAKNILTISSLTIDNLQFGPTGSVQLVRPTGVRRVLCPTIARARTVVARVVRLSAHEPGGADSRQSGGDDADCDKKVGRRSETAADRQPMFRAARAA